MATKLRPRERDAIIQSLRSGVTPRTGFQYIQVGRVKEIAAIIQDIDRVADGGATIKLVIGDFGAGKSFFLQLVKNIALEKGLVTMSADLSPERRLQSANGLALNLYQELTRNTSTRAKPDGNALNSIVEKFISLARDEADTKGLETHELIKDKLRVLNDYVGGYDFAQVILAYWQGFKDGDEDRMNNAIKWIRGEYATKVTARQDLKVHTIVNDASTYDFYKLLSGFVQLAGYKGLLINLDEMVNLYKIPNSRSRTTNYEQLLRIINDCLQGNVHGLGFVMGGTPDFLEDPRRGLFSYDALRTRLASNSFALIAGINDFSGPVMCLSSLTPEEVYVLLCNLRNVFAYYNPDKYLVPDEALTQFLEHCSKHIGDAYFKTPRNTIKHFVDFLAVIEQNPEIDWRQLLKSVNITAEHEDALEDDINEAPSLRDTPNNKNEPTKSFAQAKAQPNDADNEDDEDDLSSFTL